MRKVITITLLLLGIAVPSSGWGLVGHSIVNEAATFGAPSEMPFFFHRSYPQLIWLGYEPDRWRGAGDSIDAFNAPNHFLDYEYVDHLDLPPRRYDFIELLYESGTLRDQGIDVDSAGFLPWRIAEVTQQLEREWRNWSRDDLTSAERIAVEDSIIFLSGVLGHYVADAANPHHSTIHYNGWALTPVPDGFATDCSTHFRFETYYVSKTVDERDVFALVGPAVLRDDYFETALTLLRSSQELVPEIYTIDARGGFDPENESEEAYAFAVGRLATGAAFLRDLWWSAYLSGMGDR
ncbi:MAG: hypothetical protein R3338_01005 [Thermoanaerobaculia bacterium]|nr:hypothetical protein [Thermoanaerobaculia bacterium]